MDMHALGAIPPWEWPADAKDAILAVLRDEEAPAEERLLGAELAGDLVVMDDELAEELLRILTDPREPEDFRATAAISLGPALEEAEIPEFDDLDAAAVSEPVIGRAKSALRDCYRDPSTPKQVRRLALEASVRAPEPWHAGAVRAAYHDGDREWKLTAVFCMRFVRGFDDEVVEALGSDDAEILYEAVCAARDQEVEGAWPHVRHLVMAASRGAPLLPDDPDAEWSLLLAAMNAVANIRPMEAHDTLAGLVDSDDEAIAEAAMEVLDMVEAFWMADDEEDEEDEDDLTWSEDPGDPTWH
jgi:hypothetical protein